MLLFCFVGRNWNITVGNECRCQNFPEDASRLITSIHTNGNCVILFMDKGCYGAAVRMEDYSWGYKDLGIVGLNDVTKSLRQCGCNGDSNEPSAPIYRGTTPAYA